MTRIILAVAGALVGCAVSVSAQSAQVEEGTKVYAAQMCTMCHAIAGAGNAKSPLDGVGSTLSAGDVRAWIVDAATMAVKATARPGQRAYQRPADDLDALVAHMQSLKKK